MSRYTSGARSAPYLLYGYRLNINENAIFLMERTAVSIPDGTYVDCNAYVWSVRVSDGVSTMTFDLTLDGVACGTYTSFGTTWANKVWTKIGTTSPIRVSGDTHTLKIRITTSRNDYAGTAFGLDDFSVMPVYSCSTT